MSKNVLITGVGGGFGKLIARVLTEDGYSIFGTMRDVNGRNKENKIELEKLGIKVFEMDVTNTKSVDNVIDHIMSKVNLDVLINNAGVGVLGNQETFTPEDFQKLFDINVFGVQRVNRAMIPYFRKNGNGLIIYISSLLGRISVPFYGPYNASKWALEALAENYRIELSGFGIESCIVEPGGYPTTFIDNLIRPSDVDRKKQLGEFADFPEEFLKGFEHGLASNPEQDPRNVAIAILELIKKPKGEKPFRTIVDKMGMGTYIEEYNQHLSKVTEGIYAAFGISHLLTVKK
ncbi:MAG TPA: SDR family oxidoreductase [Leptospiraceae bacterium]|nr:SDR family oxidoreductase [Leptospiraceae bacterium]HMW06810.1 SDR family oxidoreductase [Leptospiraceae bacterium]HMX32173.1 SDR family oxidoreductase [Leptospiraceae bacterium]HMY32243.1 SDR family oxidoreductase [Leptospiraceae bacterium]HMZ63933.1 SDR family oxidoreductase [Leptospiraceae bacterium]